MPPTVENDSCPEWLTFRRHNYAVVLSPGAGACFTPMQLERRELQHVEVCQQVFRPLEAEAAFSDSCIDQKIMEERWTDNLIFPPQVLGSGVSHLRHASGLVGADGRSE